MTRRRHRLASRRLLPSAVRRAMSARVSGSMRRRTSKMVCSARLSWRSPPRLSRWRVTCPEEAGIGLVAARAAKAASERRRPACDQLTSTWAALRGPTPGTSSSHRGSRSDQHGQLGLEELDALGGGPQGAHGGPVLQRPGGPLSQAGAVVDLAAGVAAAQLGPQLLGSADDECLELAD